jgi:hypothetical protein
MPTKLTPSASVLDEVAESHHERLLAESKYVHGCLVEVMVHVSRLVVPNGVCNMFDSIDHAREVTDLIVIKGSPLPLACWRYQTIRSFLRAIEDDGLRILGVYIV